MAKSIPGQLSMFEPTTSEASRNATSSQASADGALRSDLQDGPTTGPSGPVPAPASPSPSRGKGKARQTNDISGLSSTASFQGADRLSYSVSKSLQQSGRLGSTECSLIWKVRATPAGRLFFQLVPSMRPIGEIDFGLWPTPLSAPTSEATPTSLSPAKDGNNEAGNSAGLVAIRQHALAMWATPSARDWKDTPGMAQTGIDPDGSTRSRVDQLPRQVAAMWPTPRQQDGKHGAATDYELNRETGKDLVHVAAARAHGAAPSGSSARTEKPGALAPEFVSWLMGFPPEWMECAPTAMPKRSK
jgi:hypothetical protein